MPPPYQQFPPPPPLLLPPRQPRPSGWWWLLPASMFVAAAAVFAFALLPVFIAPFKTDAHVPFDGRPHGVTLDGTGDRQVWFPYGTSFEARCLVRDAPTNRSLTLSRLSGTLTRTVGSRVEVAAYQFSPVSEHLIVRCSPGIVRSASVPDVTIGPGIAARTALGALLLLLALGGLGAVVTLVLIILFATRGPRPTATA